MPAKSDAYWLARAVTDGATWYRHPVLDGCMERLWHDAVRRLAPPFLRGDRVLDVGCGDGRFSVWLAQEYQVQVLGCDLFEYRARRHPQVRYQWDVDAEHLEAVRETEAVGYFDFVIVSGVLECVDNWQAALAQALSVARNVLLVEDLPVRANAFQQGLPHKHALTHGEVVAAIEQLGWRVVREVSMTVLDRALVAPTPRRWWAMLAPVSMLVDLVLCRWPGRRIRDAARFRALLLQGSPAQARRRR